MKLRLMSHNHNYLPSHSVPEKCAQQINRNLMLYMQCINVKLIFDPLKNRTTWFICGRYADNGDRIPLCHCQQSKFMSGIVFRHLLHFFLLLTISQCGRIFD